MGKRKGANKGFCPTDHVFDGGEDLGEGDLADVVGQLALVADLVVEVPPAGVLQHQVEAARRLHHFVQTQHIGVAQELHAADLPGEETLGLGVQPGLVQDLQGHFVCEESRRRDTET